MWSMNMQACRSTSLLLSSGTRRWLHLNTLESTKETAWTNPSSAGKAIEQVNYNVETLGYQHQIRRISRLSPASNSRISQQQEKTLIEQSGQTSCCPPFLSRVRGSQPRRESTSIPAKCLPFPLLCRSYSSSAEVSTKSSQLQSEVRRFLRQKGVDFSETHSCLRYVSYAGCPSP